MNVAWKFGNLSGKVELHVRRGSDVPMGFIPYLNMRRIRIVVVGGINRKFGSTNSKGTFLYCNGYGFKVFKPQERYCARSHIFPKAP